MIVMKFGGTSLGDAARIDNAAQLVGAAEGPRAVVASAMGGVTDRLLAAGDAAEAGDAEAVAQILGELRARHLAVSDHPEVVAEVGGLLDELEALLHGVRLLRETTPRTRAVLVSFGERMSVPLLAAALRARGERAIAVDARGLIRTDGRHEEATVDLDATRSLVRQAWAQRSQAGEIPVITGFIGSTAQGITTTLGRSGSDYTAALIGACLDASEVWIWTDVDGILTADPRLVSEARTLTRVSYAEAAEMSYFGAKVLHPRTMGPCADRGIPIRIRSTFEPDKPGTVVAQEGQAVPQGVKTVTSVHGMALITLAGRGMAGLPGVARRIFEATERAGANVVMISQASSEQTVSIVVKSEEAEPLRAAIEALFRLELAEGILDRVQVVGDAAIVSIIGEGMAGRAGVSGTLFSALGDAGVNVLAIAQGGGEQSISVAVRERDARRAVRSVHTAFGLTRVVHLVLVGCGRVGRTLLGMLEDTRERMARQDLELRLIAVMNRSRWVFDLAGLDPAGAADALVAAEGRPDDAGVIARIAEERLTDVVLVDVTAGPTAALHALALGHRMHVVTANKVPLAGPQAEYDGLVAAKEGARVRYGYETTFGAGLPVLHALKELVATGDQLLEISGCFSGTLGYVCTELQSGRTLAEAVRQAADLGYTEPDPREDLSGRDVARKALIVARAIGVRMGPEDVLLDPLVPGLEGGLDQALDAYQPVLAARMAEAAEAGQVLRYVARITPEQVSVGMQAVAATGPIGGLQGPDNILVFKTARYASYPLVIRGPGAGAEVTAAGVLGDILKVAYGR